MIKTKDDPNMGFNEHTLEWKGKKLKEMTRTGLIDIIVHLFTVCIAMQQEIKATQRILEPNPLWRPN